MSSFTTYNVSFGCPKCGACINSKYNSNEGALTELECDECGEIQSLGNKKEISNGDLPAMPFIEPSTECSVSLGMTKRELIAMHFHAALLTAHCADGQWTGLLAKAEDLALDEADNLLKRLEK